MRKITAFIFSLLLAAILVASPSPSAIRQDPEACSALQDDRLLQEEYVLLPKGSSQLLQQQACKRWMLS